MSQTRINKVVAITHDHYEGDDKEKMTDLITDIRHFCAQQDLDFHRILRMTDHHCDVERVPVFSGGTNASVEVEWKRYRKAKVAEMRPYVPGELLNGIGVQPNDYPTAGGMIARDASNHNDQWYVSPEFFKENYEPEDECADEFIPPPTKDLATSLATLVPTDVSDTVDKIVRAIAAQLENHNGHVLALSDYRHRFRLYSIKQFEWETFNSIHFTVRIEFDELDAREKLMGLGMAAWVKIMARLDERGPNPCLFVIIRADKCG